MAHGFALIDCNDFYVSCERAFDPALRGRAVVVLSNNDGCVISRSEEAKAAGIRMGAPLFEAARAVEEHGVEVFSSNYSLYGDMSGRLFEVLEGFTPEIERYSIDEAFLRVEATCEGKAREAADAMRERILKWTGLPVTVGVGPTKTLAKLAARVAKRSERARGFVNLTSPVYLKEALARVRVEDVWGVGPARARVLRGAGVATALDFSRADEHWARARLGVVGARILNELRGVPCLPLEIAPRPRRSVTSSRSFGRPVVALAELCESVAFHVTRAAEKLRRAGLAATALLVFVETGRFSRGPQHSGSASAALPVPTALITELVAYARACAERAYREGFEYKKAGVMLLDLVPESPAQAGLFDARDRERHRRVMRAVDEINRLMGRGTVRTAAEG
ncbi:MAG TPA: DUF4113 domain-containing protein, partial [Pyrinomonadaceae bacterium]|nr:DUF4113 domain-containing protein [Pyrinomonadaceae bacterium]